MGILRVDHPDILDFIVCKEREGILRNFNISVAVNDKFMDAVEKDKEFELLNPRTKKPVKRIKARAIWNLIVTMAWKNGEPGVIFIDTINRYNPTPHVGEIESTNPCIAGDCLISTERGLEKMSDLVERFLEEGAKVVTDNRVPIIVNSGKQKLLMCVSQSGTSLNRVAAAWRTGFKETYKLITESGYELIATPDHKIFTSEGWVPLKDCLGKEVLIQSGEGMFNQNSNLPFEVQNEIIGRNGRIYRNNFPKKWSKELGNILGWLVGDGWLISKGKNCRVGFTFSKDERKILEFLKSKINNFYGKEIKEVKRKNGVYHLSYHSKSFVDFFLKLGVDPEKNHVPKSIFVATKEAVVGFLQGLFSSDGTIGLKEGKSSYIRLTSKSESLLKEVQLLLINLGIKSRIYDRSRAERETFSYVNKKGELKKYISDGTCFELEISRESVIKFLQKIGFLENKFEEKIKKLRRKNYMKDIFFDRVKEILPAGQRLVYDLTEPMTHSFICHGIVVSNCGEQPLLPYESCNLGSINLSKFVEDGKIDWERLRKTVRLAVRFLDNVIDANYYPISQIEQMTKANRKIGLGVMGFADMLIQLNIPYNSEEGLKVAEEVMKFISEEARKMSVELGEEKGSFPNFKGSVWEKKGYKTMRNATVTTIAPTGTIGVIAGCSSGIEPLFAIAYLREVSESLGTNLVEINPLFETIAIREGFYTEDLMKKISGRTSVQEVEEIPENIRKIFVTAHDIAPEWHVRMQAAFQKYTDNAVSKTINFPYHATPHDVEKAYLLAYKLGCKGITIYRHGSREVQVLRPISEASSVCPTCTLYS